MRSILKNIGTILYYLMGVGILAYIVFSIGLNNIYHILASVNFSYILLALGITIASSALRIYKTGILLSTHTQAEVFDLFVFSRVGKELSYAGYFFPIAKKNNRNLNTVKNLLIDRYTEIFSTILIGLISLLYIMKDEFIYRLLLGLLGGAVLLLLLIPLINTKKAAAKFNNKYFSKFIEVVSSLQHQVNIARSGILYIYFLSVTATCLDFMTAYVLMFALDIHINIFIIPIVWASSGLIAMVGFMIIGTTEISVIYLYEKLANINTAVTASFVFISRLVNILALLILLVINLGILGVNKTNVSKAKAL